MVRQEKNRLQATWPIGSEDHGRLTIDLQPGHPVIHLLEVAGAATGPWDPLLAAVDPQITITTGTRKARGGRPEHFPIWNVFFPLEFAEIISGDGERVYRERTDLADTGALGRRTWTLRPDLGGRKWVRLEAWDVGTNGAFTQPVWLAP